MRSDALDLIQTTLLGEAAEHAPIAILVADDDMRYLAVNRRACQLFGYEREELLQLSVASVTPIPEARDRFDELIQRRSLTGTMEAQHRDGTTFTIRYQAVETTVAGMRVYVSFVEPVDTDGRGDGRR